MNIDSMWLLLFFLIGSLLINLIILIFSKYKAKKIELDWHRKVIQLEIQVEQLEDAWSRRHEI